MGGDARFVPDLATGEDLDRLGRIYGLVRNRIVVWAKAPALVSAERIDEKLSSLETRLETDTEFRARLNARLRDRPASLADVEKVTSPMVKAWPDLLPKLSDMEEIMGANRAYYERVSDLYLAANTRRARRLGHHADRARAGMSRGVKWQLKAAIETACSTVRPPPRPRPSSPSLATWPGGCRARGH